MRDLVAKSTNPESVQPDSLSSSPSLPQSSKSAPGLADPSTDPPAGTDPGPWETAEISTEPPAEVAELAEPPASCLVASQSLDKAPELRPRLRRLHLVEPLPTERGPRIDASGRRRARIHTLFRPPGDDKYLDRRPLLRLTGKWLEDAGFPIGQPIAIRVEAGRLVIEAL